MKMTDQQRLYVLGLIEENKDELLSKLNVRKSATELDQLWSSLWDACVRAGLPFAHEGRGPSHLRDQVWQTLKRSTLVFSLKIIYLIIIILVCNPAQFQRKVDAVKKQTGKNGPFEQKSSDLLSSVDVKVLQILGEESPSVYGIATDNYRENVSSIFYV